MLGSSGNIKLKIVGLFSRQCLTQIFWEKMRKHSCFLIQSTETWKIFWSHSFALYPLTHVYTLLYSLCIPASLSVSLCSLVHILATSYSFRRYGGFFLRCFGYLDAAFSHHRNEPHGESSLNSHGLTRIIIIIIKTTVREKREYEEEKKSCKIDEHRGKSPGDGWHEWSLHARALKSSQRPGFQVCASYSTR